MKKTRLLALLLCFITVLIPVSCAKNNEGTDTTTTAPDIQQTTSEAVTTAPIVDENAYPENSLPDNLNFGGEELDMLASEWQGYEYYFFADEQNGDAMNDAIYSRKMAVEEALNIKMVTHQKGFSISEVASELKRVVLAGESLYDLVFNHCIEGISASAANGYLYNLDTLPHINMQAEWWNREQMDMLRLGKNTYYAVNDMMIPCPYVIFFNKEMVEQENLEDPYQLVYSGDWTLDKMGEMAAHVSTDLDGNGVHNHHDRWGLIVQEPSKFISFMTGAGQYMTERDADGRVQLAMNTEKMNSLMEFFADLTTQNVINRSTKSSDTYVGMATGRILFEADSLAHAELFRDLEVEYGMLPYPKYDKEQEDYISLDWGGLLSVPNNIANPDMVGAAMEMLAWESAREVLPAYYDVVLTGKLSRDEDAARMLELLFDTITYEIGGNYFGFEAGATDLFYVIPRKAVDE
ncbi:MAG: hypothetical protein IJF53_03720, partial [Clostridia bacterium]|nr:hypothetical protein [Clostridia bacterium]